MDSLLPCDEGKKSIFEIDTLYRCNSLDKNTTFPPKQRSKSPSRQSETRREDQPHVRFAKEPSLEFHIPECSEESEDRESPLPILCSTLHPKPILKKTTPRKTHACTIIVYGEWAYYINHRSDRTSHVTCPNGTDDPALTQEFSSLPRTCFVSKRKELEPRKMNAIYTWLYHLFAALQHYYDYAMCKRKRSDDFVLIGLATHVYESD